MSLTSLERSCLDHIRLLAPLPRLPAPDDWLAFCLVTLFDVCRTLRQRRSATRLGGVDRKVDGTPTTPLEREIEERVRTRLATFRPDASLLGEETGGNLAEDGYTLALDPIDGTWPFLNGTEEFSSTLAVYVHGKPVLGMVASPSTGEIAYGGEDQSPRLVRLSTFGEGDRAEPLPLESGDGRKLLVNLHPARAAAPVAEVLYRAWGSSHIRALRSPGGSPALALTEAVKGRSTYVNLWTRRRAEPFDLAAPTLVMRAAGGDVVSLDGKPVDPAAHAGPFVAGLDAEHREEVALLVRRSLERKTERPMSTA